MVYASLFPASCPPIWLLASSSSPTSVVSHQHAPPSLPRVVECLTLILHLQVLLPQGWLSTSTSSCTTSCTCARSCTTTTTTTTTTISAISCTLKTCCWGRCWTGAQDGMGMWWHCTIPADYVCIFQCGFDAHQTMPNCNVNRMCIKV